MNYTNIVEKAFLDPRVRKSLVPILIKLANKETKPQLEYKVQLKTLMGLSKLKFKNNKHHKLITYLTQLIKSLQNLPHIGKSEKSEFNYTPFSSVSEDLELPKNIYDFYSSLDSFILKANKDREENNGDYARFLERELAESLRHIGFHLKPLIEKLKNPEIREVVENTPPVAAEPDVPQPVDLKAQEKDLITKTVLNLERLAAATKIKRFEVFKHEVKDSKILVDLKTFVENSSYSSKLQEVQTSLNASEQILTKEFKEGPVFTSLIPAITGNLVTSSLIDDIVSSEDLDEDEKQTKIKELFNSIMSSLNSEITNLKSKLEDLNKE